MYQIESPVTKEQINAMLAADKDSKTKKTKSKGDEENENENEAGKRQKLETETETETDNKTKRVGYDDTDIYGTTITGCLYIPSLIVHS